MTPPSYLSRTMLDGRMTSPSSWALGGMRRGWAQLNTPALTRESTWHWPCKDRGDNDHFSPVKHHLCATPHRRDDTAPRWQWVRYPPSKYGSTRRLYDPTHYGVRSTRGLPKGYPDQQSALTLTIGVEALSPQSNQNDQWTRTATNSCTIPRETRRWWRRTWWIPRCTTWLTNHQWGYSATTADIVAPRHILPQHD
jgi:hypothetical protein